MAICWAGKTLEVAHSIGQICPKEIRSWHHADALSVAVMIHINTLMGSPAGIAGISGRDLYVLTANKIGSISILLRQGPRLIGSVIIARFFIKHSIGQICPKEIRSCAQESESSF